MKQQLEQIVHKLKDAFEMNEQIKNMSEEEKQKAFSEYYKDYYEKLFSNHTLNEIKEITKQPKKELMKIHEDYNIESPMYVNRTYSGGLVPINSQLGKYDTPKKRGKYNDYFDWEANKEGEYLQQMTTTLSSDLGVELAICSQKLNKFAKTQQQLKTYKLLLDAYEDAKKKDDWLCYIEEERYGNRPEIDNIFDKELFSEEVMYAFIAQKYGLEKALIIKQLLQGEIHEAE